jgi:hypothetical protein
MKSALLALLSQPNDLVRNLPVLKWQRPVVCSITFTRYRWLEGPGQSSARLFVETASAARSQPVQTFVLRLCYFSSFSSWKLCSKLVTGCGCCFVSRWQMVFWNHLHIQTFSVHILRFRSFCFHPSLLGFFIDGHPELCRAFQLHNVGTRHTEMMLVCNSSKYYDSLTPAQFERLQHCVVCLFCLQNHNNKGCILTSN